MKPTSLLAVLVGSGVGVAVAVAWQKPSDNEQPPPLPPAAARPLPPKPPRPAIARDPREAARSASAREPFPPPERPIASREEFVAAAIACDEKDAGACRRAALAVEVGEVVPKDLERARTLRKVELTIIVRACEKGDVEACLSLADRYLRGDGLAQNEKTATALIEHARELCARRPSDACRGVPAE